ncbi:MAG TPA: extracellular solute-binding protein [Candidatus Deferrimicrobium sp.]|nr:extracellular solute-binding protein [Candidatus Deferrimicrobium sp.]
MTRFGTMWRRGFVLAASLALLASVAPAATFAQDEAGGEVVVMTYFSKDLGETALKDLLAQFEADSGVTVQFADVGHEDFKTGILIQLAGGNPPDVHSNWAGARTAFQVQNGALAPLDEMWAANDLDSQFPQGLIDSAATYDGAKYLLPLGYHYAGMFYNPKTFESAGVAVPTTWDELKASCDAFNAAGIVPISLGSMNKWPAQFWFDYLLLRTAGPEYRAKLMAGEAAYTDPEVVRAMELWAELANAKCFTPDANAFDWTDAADQVANGEAAMNLMGTWITGYWNGNGLVPATDYDFFEFPVIDEGVATAVVGPVDGLVSAAGAANPEAAMALIASLATPEAQTAWAVGQGALPPNVNADKAQFNEVILKALDVVAASETYNFNYDLATPPAPSEVGLDMFQKFVADPAQDVNALLAETQTAIEAAFANQ